MLLWLRRISLVEWRLVLLLRVLLLSWWVSVDLIERLPLPHIFLK